MVSTPALDQIMDTALSAGALGGKVLGAGGGGFMLFYVEQGNQERVRNKLNKLIEVEFGVDEDGSSVIL